MMKPAKKKKRKKSGHIKAEKRKKDTGESRHLAG